MKNTRKILFSICKMSGLEKNFRTIRTKAGMCMIRFHLGIRRQAIDGQLVGRGFWHCNASRDNKWAAGDTFGGNVWLVNVQTGERHWLASDTR